MKNPKYIHIIKEIPIYLLKYGIKKIEQQIVQLIKYKISYKILSLNNIMNDKKYIYFIIYILII